jgi:hypothetical protein
MESNEASGPSQETPAGIRRRVGMIFAVVVGLGLAGGVFWRMGFGSYPAQRQEYLNQTETFAGSSESLQQTVIVPTLDSPCPPNKNVIWCSSFQLAWNEVRDKVIGAPLEVIGAEETAARLNTARQSTSDLEPSSFYAAGGWVEDRIRDKIRKDMAVKFPGHVLPDFSSFDSGILAYSYLAACVPFKYPFRQVDGGSVFNGSQGVGTAVEAFGLSEIDESRYQKIREQVAVLYCRRSDAPSARREMVEYALDLCRHSQPYEVVVAMVESKASLAQTLEYVRLQVHESKSRGYSKDAQALGHNDVVKVPEMVWRIDHRFSELIGKNVANVGMPVVEALQTTAFRLDRSGAMLKSEATLAVKRSPRYFLFDRPFLVYMQKRGAEHPFFVMWVDNAELLTRK